MSNDLNSHVREERLIWTWIMHRQDSATHLIWRGAIDLRICVLLL